MHGHRNIKHTNIKHHYFGLETRVDTFVKNERYTHFHLSVRIPPPPTERRNLSRPGKLGESNTHKGTTRYNTAYCRCCYQLYSLSKYVFSIDGLSVSSSGRILFLDFKLSPCSWNLWTLTSWNPLDHSRPVMGLLFFYLNVVCFLLGNSPASEFYAPTFGNTLFHLHRQAGIPTCLPMKMEQSVPKRRRIKFWRRGISQKKVYRILYLFHLKFVVPLFRKEI